MVCGACAPRSFDVPSPRFAPTTSAASCGLRRLLEAREKFKTESIDAASLRRVEDEAIRDIVKFQETSACSGVTDGEFRRTYFHIDFLTQLEGVSTKGGIAVSFHSNAGNVDFAPPVMQVTGKVRHVKADPARGFRVPEVGDDAHAEGHDPVADDAAFSRRSRRDQPRGVSGPHEFYEDVAAAYRDEIRSLADAGCTYVQLDDTNLAYLCDEKMREGARSRGDDPNDLPRRYAALINAAIRDRPEGMTVCIHLCRGNFKSAWAAEGGYEPVAEVLFNELDVDGYFLEYDDARSGDFAPLRFVPKGKTVVLGLVSTKLDRMETKDGPQAPDRRGGEVRAARAVLPVAAVRLLVSTVHGNEIHVETQAAKLRLCVETAQEVWGAV